MHVVWTGVPTIVQVLPDHVIDQIAAGEVVERPASVVKELVENALDAGARAITVEVDGGGRRLVRVVDDGSGMSAEDARLALQRHATSKLRTVDDLADLATMGFRGEALPSIAAVSRLVLTTRRREDEAARRILVEGGRVIDETMIGAPVGTTVEVADLLHNVPARLKFLRGEATEASHVTETMLRLAMAHPEVAFRVRQSGRIAFEVPAHGGDLATRVRAVLGGRLAERLHPVEHEEGGVRVRCFLAAPDLAQTTSRGVQLFAGRRWIRDRALLQAVTMGYGELVPRGRYPVVVAMVDVPGGDIDVNVHPQKLEVRFSDAAAVSSAVRHAVRKGVAAAPWLAEHGAFGHFASGPVKMHAVTSVPQPPPPRRADDLADRYADDTVRALFPLGGLGRPMTRQETFGAPAREGGAGAWERVRAKVLARDAAPRVARDPEPTPAPCPPPPAADGTPNGFFSSLRYLGQLDRTYLICEADDELVLIDQHAAHERVAFQRLRERADAAANAADGGGGVPIQRLLFPTTVDLAPAEAALATDSHDLLAAVGFDVEPFGPTTIAVKAVPAGLRHDPTAVLRELLDDLADRGGSRAVDERLDHVLATIACHSVVRAGDVLGPDQARALLDQMDGVDFRAHCPHGRPVLLRIGVPEIARRFGRT